MNHIFIDDEGLTDPYFTREEWSKVQKTHENHFGKAKGLIKKGSEGFSLPEECKECLYDMEAAAFPLCACFAHAAGKFYDRLQRIAHSESASLNVCRNDKNTTCRKRWM